MKSLGRYGSYWSGGVGVPNISPAAWNLLAVPAAVFAVMGILQVIGFGSFKDYLDGVGIGAPAVTAALLIVAEFWAALSLLRVPLPAAFRYFGVLLALLVSGFWFIENLYFITSSGGQLPNSGYFGKYLTQSPGWATAVEASVMLYWTVYAAETLKWKAD